MRKIAFLGGTFDPITNAHIEIAKKISDKFDLDIVFLPAKNTRWKDKISNNIDRLNMLKLAIKGLKRVSINTFELFSESNDTNYTFDTILSIMDDYKDCELYYIIGTDQLQRLDERKNIDELSTLVKFIVIEREGYPINKENLELFNCIDSKITLENISSSEIRDGNSKETCKEVLDYITTKGLYFDNKLGKILDKDRLEHSIRVANCAKEIALANNYDSSKAYVAGLLHDCAKNIPYSESLSKMMELEPTHIKEGSKLFHQYLAPYYARKYFEVEDEEIFNAIKYHTTSRKEASTLDKIIYCADKVEPGRDFDTEYLREQCKKDIEIGYILTYKDNMEHILSSNKNVSKECLDIYRECKNQKNLFKLKEIVKLLDDKFTNNLKVIDVSSINPIHNYAIIANCDSDRQLLSLGDDVEDLVVKGNLGFHHKEAQYKSGWVLIDCNDIIVHLFKNESRFIYGLDEQWSNLPIIDIDSIINKKIKV